MNFTPSESQLMIADTFGKLFDDHGGPQAGRRAKSGFDAELWRAFAALGGFGLRVQESSDGGSGLGLFDAALAAEQIGRTLAPGPILEGVVCARLLSRIFPEGQSELLNQLLGGDAVVTLALRDVAEAPVQWVNGGAAADAVLCRDRDKIFLVRPTAAERRGEPNLASAAIAEIRLDAPERELAANSAAALTAFSEAVEEWKLLTAAALAGLSREAISLAASYACERHAFDQPIGAYQGISHPLADLVTDVTGGRLLVWKTIRDVADNAPRAGASISLSLWWNAQTAGRATAQALHTFGGYGLSTEYDIHLFNLRSRALPLIYGDPAILLSEAGRRLYADDDVDLPDAGETPIEFNPGPEAEALANDLDAFFKETLTPELKAKAHFSFDGHDPAVHKQLAEARLLFPAWPKSYGGREVSRYAAAAATAMWERHEWSGHAAATTGMVGFIIQRFGGEQLKREVLNKIAAGECICSLGFSEPGSGSDVFAAKTRARREGEFWRIDGQKMFTSGADKADYILLLARTNSDAPKHKGVTMFIVPAKAPSVAVQPVYTMQDEQTNITFYDGVRVPDSYRVGEIDGGLRVMAASLELEHGANFIATQERMLEAAAAVCRELKRNGRPMIEEPAVQARLASVAAHNAITEVLGNYALWSAEQKHPNRGESSMSKLFSSEKFRTDSADLLDLTAPHSLSKRKGPLEFLNQCYRHSQGTTIYAGTSEIHRSMIAERGLALPRTRA